MKKTLLSITVLLLLASCSKRIDTPLAYYGKTPEICNFGLTEFNLTKRPPLAANAQKNTQGEDPAPGGAVILLDFDGAVVDGTGWNSYFVCAPANLSGDNITEVINRLKNDFSPFNVTITTDEWVYNAANVIKRTRVIITESYEWFGSYAGGVSFVGSFTWGDNTPCFVFSSLLFYNIKRISEAASHEAGHTMGLWHQAVYNMSCIQTAGYNPGLGSGENGWAPIMGVGYYQNATLWHNGPNSFGCTSYQDEMTVISSVAGGFKADDYSNSSTNAAILTSSLEGLINNSSDIDFFYLHITDGKTISVLPYSVGPNNAGANVNLVLKVYDRNGKLLSIIDDPETLEATIKLARGKYFISVSTAANQYAAVYGMLGKYSIAVN